MLYFDSSKGRLEKIERQLRITDHEINMRLDGHVAARPASIPTKPLLLAPPQGEVSDEEEKVWRRKLQSLESAQTSGIELDE